MGSCPTVDFHIWEFLPNLRPVNSQVFFVPWREQKKEKQEKEVAVERLKQQLATMADFGLFGLGVMGQVSTRVREMGLCFFRSGGLEGEGKECRGVREGCLSARGRLSPPALFVSVRLGLA